MFVRVVFTGHVCRLLLFYMNAKLGGLAAKERVKMEVSVRVQKINAAVLVLLRVFVVYVCVCTLHTSGIVLSGFVYAAAMMMMME